MSCMSGLRKVLATDPCLIVQTFFARFLRRRRLPYSARLIARSPRSRLGLISGVGISGLPEPHGLRAEESFTFSSARLALAPSQVPGYGSLVSPRSWSRGSCNGVHHPRLLAGGAVLACGHAECLTACCKIGQRARSSRSHRRNVDRLVNVARTGEPLPRFRGLAKSLPPKHR
jgi:hypothetical protein